MLSKFLPWDFVNKYPNSLETKRPGVYAFLVTNPYLQKIIIDRIPKSEVELSIYSGNEITRDFLEENFVNLSFFSEQNNILSINAENVPSETLELFVENRLDVDARFLVMFFSKKNKFFTDLTKLESVVGLEVEEPRFWEGQRLWQFLLQQNSLKIPPEVTSFVLENLEHNFESFVWVIDLIKQNFSDSKIDLNLLRELVKKQRWDIFELVAYFDKGPKAFFGEMLKNEEADLSWYRSVFSFMQSHLYKAVHPDEILQKGKLSKYDQQILDLSKKYNKDLLLNYIRKFSELEIEAKLGNQLVVDLVRLEMLK